MGVTLFWFRRDLRLEDNHGLYQALKTSKKVRPLFIFDSHILNKLPQQDARVEYILNALGNLNDAMKKNRCCIGMYHGEPKAILNKLIENEKIERVLANHDYEPYARERDQEIKSFLKTKGVRFETYKDQVIFEKGEVVKNDSTPYKVYTPYSRRWIERWGNEPPISFPSENLLHHLESNETQPQTSLSDLGFKKSNIKLPTFITNERIMDEYEATRNYPALDSTSRVGTALRFGTISIRKLAMKAAKRSEITYFKELIWREFFMQILWHFPHTVERSFKPQYDRIEWRNNEDEFARWCAGETGYPFVDAGMKELNATGFMHNRVRMLVGSFLCKHLLIDWRWGEAYFAEKLMDFEKSSNVGNWQWVAGCGVDAAPYFRIFNPTDQIKKFDKQHDYLKKWVPNYQELDYPQPLVDHKRARERCLATYKAALNA